MLDPRDLPYAENSGAVSLTEAALLVLTSIIAGTAKLTGYLTIGWSIVLIPIVGLVAAKWLYRVIRNATHEAIRLADADAYLDEQLTSSIQKEATTLTPNTVRAKLAEMAA